MPHQVAARDQHLLTAPPGPVFVQYPATKPDSWGVRSWYVTVNTGAIMSTDLPVESGDAIKCNMVRPRSTSAQISLTDRSSSPTPVPAGPASAGAPIAQQGSSQPGSTLLV